MGLYYHPPLVTAGGQQPLQARELVPPSGPAPQNPPVVGGPTALYSVLGSWAVAAALAAGAFIHHGNAQPLQVGQIVPPQPGPVAQNPPFNGGAKAPAPILVAWIPPNPAFQVARNLSPPSAPPPIPIPASLTSVYAAWQIAPPPPQAAHNLTPPSAPFAPAMRVIGWADARPGIFYKSYTTIVAPVWTPPSGAPTLAPVVNNPPFAGPSRLTEVLGHWNASPLVIDLPQASSVASVPAFVPAPAQQLAVLAAWRTDVLPQQPRLGQVPSGPLASSYLPMGARLGTDVLANWATPPWPLQSRLNQAPSSGAAPYHPVGARLGAEVLASWAVSPWSEQRRVGQAPSEAPYFPVGAKLGADVLAGWAARDWPQQPPINAVFEAPPAGNPPRLDPGILVTIANCWLPSDPPPQFAPPYGGDLGPYVSIPPWVRRIYGRGGVYIKGRP